MKRVRARTRLAAAFVVLALFAAACGDDDDDGGGGGATTSAATATTGGDSTATTAGQAAGGDDEECTAERAGGEITMGAGSPVTGMDPAIVLGTGQVGGDYMSAFYDTLMRYDATTQEFEPNVAESLEPNEDFSVWTLTLREGITFGNGDPLTTADVEAHITRLQTSRVRAAGMAQQVIGMEIIDERTMTFDVGEPWGTFPYVLATEPGWVPNSRLVTERGDGFHVDPSGAGVGPYEVERIAPNEEIVLRAKPDYWNGPVCIERIRFVNIPGSEPTYEAFINGELDVMFTGAIQQVRQLEETGRLGFGAVVGALGYILADQGITGRSPTPFQDVRVREAMQLAIDYDAVNTRLFDGVGMSDSAMVPPESPIYHGVEGPPYDPERARQLVQETIADGTWDGHFTFLHATTPESTEQAVLFEALWEAVGMDVDLEAVPNTGQRVILERNFEVSTNGYAILDPAPWSTLNGLASDSTRQRTGYANPEMDAALKELRAASTIEETKEALAKMQEIWNETFPVIVWNHSIWAVGVAENVHGMKYGPDATPYFHKAWVDQ